jgi:hypothetical protein
MKGYSENKTRSMRRKADKHTHKPLTHSSILEEPLATSRSRIRSIGNSKGVILNNQIIEAAGLNPEAQMVVAACKGVIYIVELQDANVNTDLSTWDRHFKNVMGNGVKHEEDLFEGLKDDYFDRE